MHKYLFETLLFIVLGIHPGVVLLDHYGYNLKVSVEGSPLDLLLPTSEIPGSLWSSLKTSGSTERLHALPFLPLPSQADLPLELFFSYPKWKLLFIQQMFISACCVCVWAEGDRQ